MPERDYTVRYRIDGLPEAAAQLQAASSALNGMSASLGPAEKANAGFAAGFAQYAALSAGLSTIRDTFGIIGASIEDAREKSVKWAEEVLKIRDSVREIAMLRGEKAPTDPLIANLVGTSVRTGLKLADVQKFTTAFEGATYGARGKGFMEESQQQPIGEEAMKIASRLGLTPDAAGKLMATITTQAPLPKGEAGVSEAMNRMGTTVRLLNESKDEINPLVTALTGIAGELGDEVGSVPEIAALLTIPNEVVKPLKAATHLRQAFRGLMKMRADHPEELRFLGIDPEEQDPLKIFTAAAPILAGKGFQANAFMKMIGIGSDVERRSIGELARSALPGTDGGPSLMAQRLAMAQTGTPGNEVMAENQQFLTKTQAGIERVQQARDKASEITRGIQQSGAETLRTGATATLRDQNLLDSAEGESTTLQSMQDMAFHVPFAGKVDIREMLGLRSARQQTIDRQAYDDAAAMAARAGVAGPSMPRPDVADSWGGLARRALHPLGPAAGLFGGRITEAFVERMSGRTREQDLSETFNRSLGIQQDTVKAIESLHETVRNNAVAPAPPAPATDTFTPKGSGGASGGW